MTNLLNETTKRETTQRLENLSTPQRDSVMSCISGQIAAKNASAILSSTTDELNRGCDILLKNPENLSPETVAGHVKWFTHAATTTYTKLEQYHQAARNAEPEEAKQFAEMSKTVIEGHQQNTPSEGRSLYDFLKAAEKLERTCVELARCSTSQEDIEAAKELFTSVRTGIDYFYGQAGDYARDEINEVIRELNNPSSVVNYETALSLNLDKMNEILSSHGINKIEDNPGSTYAERWSCSYAANLERGQIVSFVADTLDLEKIQ